MAAQASDAGLMPLDRPGPGLIGLAGIVCLGLAAVAFAVVAPLPAAVRLALIGTGIALTGFAAFRSLRGAKA